MRPDLAAQPRDRGIRYDNVNSAMAEEGVIRLLMLDPELMRRADIAEGDFTSPFLGKVFSVIKARFMAGESVTSPVIAAALSPEEASHFTSILSKPASAANSERAMADYIEKIRAEKLKAGAASDLARYSEELRQKKGYGG